jgi:hypothetical protein
MSPAASTLVALASLALAALTVLVSFWNVRRQAEATMELEHAKWLREKRDRLYGRILAVLDRKKWDPIPAHDDPQWTELEEVTRLALRYASDAVLAATQSLAEELNTLRPQEGEPARPRSGLLLNRKQLQDTVALVRHIREELAGKQEAAKTWRRYDKHAE